MGQNSSANCCGTTAECSQTEVEVSEYQLQQNQLLKRPTQIPSQQGLILPEQLYSEQFDKDDMQQTQQYKQQSGHIISTEQQDSGKQHKKKNVNTNSNNNKKKNMEHHELASHLRKISNNDRIIMENSVIHSTLKKANGVTSVKKTKKELAEIVHFAKVLQLRIISSSTLQKGTVLYINAQGLENSLRKQLDGLTFFGCKKRCKNIDYMNLQQQQIDSISSYSSSSSEEDIQEEDDHTFDYVDSSQILDHIYDDRDSDIPNSNKINSQQKGYSFPKNNLLQQKKKTTELNSKNNLKSQPISSSKQSHPRNTITQQYLQEHNQDDYEFEKEEEKENNPFSVNKKNYNKSSATQNKQNSHYDQINHLNKKTDTQMNKQINNKGIKINTNSLQKTNQSNGLSQNKNLFSTKEQKDPINGQNNQNKQMKDHKLLRQNQYGEVVNDFVIPSPDPEISKRHRGKHFQVSYHTPSNSYRIKDLGIGFGCFYKLEGPLLLKDNHLLNIGMIFVVINFTLSEENTVLDASTSNNKSSNTTEQQHISSISQIKNQSMLLSQNVSNIKMRQLITSSNNSNNTNNNTNSNNNNNNININLTNNTNNTNNNNNIQQGLQQNGQNSNNQGVGLNYSLDFSNESINKISIRLKFFGGPCNGEYCVLDPHKETYATIGRNKEQASLFFDDHLLSKIQCRIVFKPNEGWYLIDGSQKRPSTNGTWLYLAEELEIYEGMIFKANQTLFQCSLQ